MIKVNVNDKEIDVKLTYDEIEDYYTIEAKNQNKVMGTLTFKVNHSKIWLYNIETKPKFQHQGVGTALIDTLEYFAFTSRIRSIEGKYYPTNYYAKPFYEKNGYKIYKDDYEWYVYKYLDLDLVQKNTKPRIRGFEVENTRSGSTREKP